MQRIIDAVLRAGIIQLHIGEIALNAENLFILHPNDVFYVYVSQWQPDPEADTPEMPGRKAIMSMLRAAQPGMVCVCGSGKSFVACCKRRNYWILVCDNPDFNGYSKVEIHTAKYHPADRQAVKAALIKDERFRCNDDSEESPHWLFQNNSPYRFTEYGEINLGDIELKPDGSLFVTAMSKVRMTVMREILEGEIGLAEPELAVEGTKGRIPKPLRLRDLHPGIHEAAGKARQVRLPGWK